MKRRQVHSALEISEGLSIPYLYSGLPTVPTSQGTIHARMYAEHIPGLAWA